jgi:D-cysteine desulfhydrase
LKNRLPYIKIGFLPTSVESLDGLANLQRGKNIYIKRDDLCGTVYGGNKVRKLEYLLGEARATGAQHIITSGAAGSNHARATATYATSLGLKTTLMLFDQPPSPEIRENLLADYCTGAELILDETYESHVIHFQNKVRQIEHIEGKTPYIIPAGGSSITGVVGFVNAAFELKYQIDSGIIVEPEAIFTAFGTMGTVAGLVLGLKAAGLKCRVHAVRVVPDFISSLAKCLDLISKTNRLLHDSDSTFPVLSIDDKDFTIENNYLGEGYGIATPEGEHFIKLIQSTDRIDLDTVYTGKCGAAFYTYLQQCSHDASVLLWNTKNSHTLDQQTASTDYHILPAVFHKYFEISK